MDNLIEIPQGQYIKFASFNINNMYSNILTGELMTILNELCNANDVDGNTM